MSRNDTLHLAQAFLSRMGGGAESAEVAELFSENMEWEIAGDTGALPWISKKSGRASVTDFVTTPIASRTSSTWPRPGPDRRSSPATRTGTARRRTPCSNRTTSPIAS
jgi:hypothetical protein